MKRLWPVVAISAALLGSCDQESNPASLSKGRVETLSSNLLKECLALPTNLSGGFKVDMSHLKVDAKSGDVEDADKMNKLYYRGGLAATLPTMGPDAREWQQETVEFAVELQDHTLRVEYGATALVHSRLKDAPTSQFANNAMADLMTRLVSSGSAIDGRHWFCERQMEGTLAESYQKHTGAVSDHPQAAKVAATSPPSVPPPRGAHRWVTEDQAPMSPYADGKTFVKSVLHCGDRIDVFGVGQSGWVKIDGAMYLRAQDLSEVPVACRNEPK